nr:GH184 muramidase [Trichocladium asperum]
MQLSLIALTLAAAVPIVSAYPVKETLNCRSGPGTSYKVVKTYKQGADVKITCQTTGPTIKGSNIWDKTQDGCYVADYYIKTGSSGYVAAKCGASGGDGGGSGTLPGLNAVQSKHAKAIVGQAKKDGVGRHGCEAGIATALVESTMYVYANNKVPKSLNYPHDRVGSDYDSVGIFQQRAIYYPNIAADMDPARSAGQFFAKMKGVSGWKTMAVGKLCQKVQVSAYPDRYAQQVSKATKICAAAGL